MFMLLSTQQCTATARVHPVHLTNQVAANLWTKPISLSQ